MNHLIRVILFVILSGAALPTYAATPVLVAHYSADVCAVSPSTIADIVSGIDATARNGITTEFTGRFCQSLSFNGDQSYASATHDSALELTDGAISLWFKLPDLSHSNDSSVGGSALLSKDSTNFSTGGHLEITVDSSGRIKFRHQTTSRSSSWQTNAVAKADTWHHLVYSFGSKGAYVYVDNQLEYSDSTYTNGLGTNSELLVFGASARRATKGETSADNFNDFMLGELDQIKFFENQPTSADVDDWYLEAPSRCTTCTTDPILVAHYSADACTLVPSTIADIVSGIDATVRNGITTEFAGRFCQSLLFNGDQSYASATHDSALELVNGAISLWFKLPDLSHSNDSSVGGSALLSKDSINYSTGGHLEITVDSSGRIKFRHQTTSRSSSWQTNAVAKADTWHHLVYSFGSKGAYVYVDNQLEYSDSTYTNGLGTNSELLVFGASARRATKGETSADNFNDFLLGELDQIKFFENQPTSADVDDWYLEAPSSCTECDPPIAEYSFEQNSWSNPGDVLDSSVPANHGDPLGSVAPFLDLSTQISCKTLEVEKNTSSSVISAVDTNVDINSLGDDGTISFWYKSNDDWSGGGSRQLLDASTRSAGNKYFFLVLQSDGSLRFGLEYSGDNDLYSTTTSYNFVADEWVHIAVTWDPLAAELQLYVNGSKATTTDSIEVPEGGSLDAMGNLYIGDNSTTYLVNGASGNSADGYFDDLRVYDSVKSKAAIEADMQDLSTCQLVVDHFEIQHDGAGLTCEAETISIKACSDTNCSILSDQSVTLDFLADDLLVSSLSFTGSTTLSFSHTTADTQTFSLSNPSITAANPLACDDGIGNSCDMTFADAGFRFLYGASNSTTLANQTAGSVFGDTVKLQAVKDIDGVCTGIFTGNKNVDLSQENVDPGGTSGLSLTIDGSDIAKHTSASNTTLNFGADSIATIPTVIYHDAGQIRLHANYDVGGVTLSGSSNAFWVSPGELIVSAKSEATNLNGASATASTSYPAGENFDLSVIAYNAATPSVITQNYVPGQIQIKLARIGPSLAGSIDGNLSYAVGSTLATNISPVFQSVSLTNFSSGVSTFNAAQYSEVGVINLDVQDSNYGNASIVVPATAINIGRFIPNHFTQTVAQDGLFQATCDSRVAFAAYSGQKDETNNSIGAISYLDNPILVITAYNKQGLITQNYYEDSQGSVNDYMKLSASDIVISLPTEDQVAIGVDSNKLPLTANMNTGILSQNDLTVVPSVALPKGVLHYQLSDDDNFFYERSANALVAPFTSDIDFTIASITDPDFVGVSTTVDTSPTGVEIQYGRLLLENSFGPETSNLPQAMQLEHFDGAIFTASSDNNCVSYDASKISLTNISFDPALTNVQGGTGNFIEGKTQSIELAAPGAGNQGQIGVSYDTYEWLKYDWDNDGTYDNSPTAVATFGLYRADDRLFHWREVF